MLSLHRQFVFVLSMLSLPIADLFTTAPPCRGGNWPGYGFNTDLKLYLQPVVLEQSAHLLALADKDRLDEMLGEEHKEEAVKSYLQYWEDNWPKMERVSGRRGSRARAKLIP